MINLKRFSLLFILFLGGIIVAILFFSWQSYQPVPAPMPQDVSLYSVTSLATSTWSEHYYSMVMEASVREAMQSLRQESERDPELLSVCHDVAHVVGRAAVEKGMPFAEIMAEQDVFCNGGYIHGALEELFSGEFTPEELGDSCNGVSTETWLGMECYHGLGHGYMFATDQSFHRSLEYCEALTTSAQRFSCADGVFMQFFTLALRTMSDESFLSFCEDQPTLAYVSTCYLYVPIAYMTRHEGDYAQAFTWCMQARRVEGRENCIRGVSSEAIKRNVSQPDEVYNLCSNTPTGFRGPCLAGLAIMYTNHFGSTAQTETMCSTWPTHEKKMCDDIIATHIVNREPETPSPAAASSDEV